MAKTRTARKNVATKRAAKTTTANATETTTPRKLPGVSLPKIDSAELEQLQSVQLWAEDVDRLIGLLAPFREDARKLAGANPTMRGLIQKSLHQQFDRIHAALCEIESGRVPSCLQSVLTLIRGVANGDDAEPLEWAIGKAYQQLHRSDYAQAFQDAVMPMLDVEWAAPHPASDAGEKATGEQLHQTIRLSDVPNAAANAPITPGAPPVERPANVSERRFNEAYHRDHAWLGWNRDGKLRSPAIRDKWNALPNEQRKELSQHDDYAGVIATGDSGNRVVKAALKLAASELAKPM